MNLNYKEPKYDADCELLEVCKELGATYNVCYKGALLSLDRCDPSQKQTMLHDHKKWLRDLEIQDREDARLLREEERQAKELQMLELRDRKAVRRSWIQLFAAAFLGAVITKAIDLLFLLL